MNNRKTVGKILWWSQKDGNGIITDPHGNEFYFDISVLVSGKPQKLERGALVLFEPGKCDKVLAAKMVTIPNQRAIQKHEETFELEKIQLQLPLEF